MLILQNHIANKNALINLVICISYTIYLCPFLPEIKTSARRILNEDAFPANNNGGPSGNDLQLAEMPTQTFKIPTDFPSGDYVVRIICKVKGEDGLADQETSIKYQKIKIEANCKKPTN